MQIDLKMVDEKSKTGKFVIFSVESKAKSIHNVLIFRHQFSELAISPDIKSFLMV